MSEMVERGARALAEQNNASDWDKIDEHDCGDRGYLLRDDYRNMARALISAMREPTKAMISAGGDVENSNLIAELVWVAMVDEALK